MQKLSEPAQRIIEGYLNLPFEHCSVSAPYYNNKRQKVRGALRVLIGKGSPEDIVEEARIFSIKEKIDLSSLSPDALKHYLVDHNLGVDCSAFAYFVLDAECKARGRGALSSRLSYRGNFLRKLRARLRPVENTNVETFWGNKNSTEVQLSDVQPGDMIIMIGAGRGKDMNHMLIVERVEHGAIAYAHSFRWSSDGQYGHGARRGTICVTHPAKGILEQEWTEQGKVGADNETFRHAQEAKVLAIKRLRALQ